MGKDEQIKPTGKRKTVKSASDEKPKRKAPKKKAGDVPPTVFKDRAFDAILSSINQSEIVKLEALTKGYHSPDKIAFGGHNAKSYQPDALAHYNEHTDIYAMEQESDKKAIAKNLGKWILFSLEAKKNRGDFYIVTSEDSYDALREIISAKQINAMFITLDSVLEEQ